MERSRVLRLATTAATSAAHGSVPGRNDRHAAELHVAAMPGRYARDLPELRSGTCARKARTGTYPNCIKNVCPQGTVGQWPNCRKLTCPNGTHGTYPNCIAVCPAGTHGIYPNCIRMCARKARSVSGRTAASWSARRHTRHVSELHSERVPARHAWHVPELHQECVPARHGRSVAELPQAGAARKARTARTRTASGTSAPRARSVGGRTV